MAGLGFHCCLGCSLVVANGGLLSNDVNGLLIARVPLIAEHRLRARGLQ